MHIFKGILPLWHEFVDPLLNVVRTVVATVDGSLRLLLTGEIETVLQPSLPIAAETSHPVKFRSVVPGLVDDSSDRVPVALWIIDAAS